MTDRVENTNNPVEQQRILTEAMGLVSDGKHPSGAIYAQEARGQKSLCNSAQLPVDGTKGKEDVWAKLGITFGPVGSDIFRDAELPAGWKKKPTDHSMWNELVDDQGRVRAMMFYKAAFYDRSAHISLERRFSCQRDYDATEADPTKVRWVVRDKCKNNEVVFDAVFDTPHKENAQGREYWDALDKIEREHGRSGGCNKWLDENYPDHNDPVAYWE
jgi:hypothetical protein